MASNPTLFQLELPFVESGRIYQPSSLARAIQNFEPTPEGTLKSVRGPAKYEIHDGQTVFGQVFGCYHSSSMAGANDLLLVRAGSTLYRHAGWSRSWVAILSGLNSEDRQKYPDSFVEINGKVCWSNGVDRPQVIDSSTYYGNLVHPLGFERGPAAPAACGPNVSDDTSVASDDVPPNWYGYSHQGRIGTPGDVDLGEDGCLTAGNWQYALCYEDFEGNLSPLSTGSNVISVVTQSAGYLPTSAPTVVGGTPYKRVNQVDDMTRAFLVKGLNKGPDHTKAIRVYRTMDTKHFEGGYHLLVRIPGNLPFQYPDNIPDGILANTPMAEDVTSVPQYKVACEYQGRLVIGNTAANPGLIRFSQPNFPGTFHTSDYVIPDSTGAEVTGLISMGGNVLAFTPRSTYLISLDAEGLRSTPLSKTIGCIAPQSLVCIDDGSVVWLGRDGVYSFIDGGIKRISNAITPLILRLNQSRAGRACAIYDPTTSEYKLSVATDAHTTNNLILCYDIQRDGWREQRLGLNMAAMCVTNDDRRYAIACGYDGSTWDVYVLDYQSRTYTPPTKRFLFRSGEIRIGRDQSGLQRFKATKLLIGIVEADSNAKATVRYYKDGRSDNPVSTTMKLVEDDFLPNWAYGGAVIGTDIFRDPKVCWVRVDIDVTNCTSFRFEIELFDTDHIVLQGLAFLGEAQDHGGNRVTSATWSTP